MFDAYTKRSQERPWKRNAIAVAITGVLVVGGWKFYTWHREKADAERGEQMRNERLTLDAPSKVQGEGFSFEVPGVVERHSDDYPEGNIQGGRAVDGFWRGVERQAPAERSGAPRSAHESDRAIDVDRP